MLSAQGIRDAIVAGDAATLELAKAMVLQPVLDHYGCLESGAPNSVSHWFSPSSAASGQGPRVHRIARHERVGEKLDRLASPVTRGLDLCRRPGTGVSEQARDLQRRVQDTVEKPMIPALLAGEGVFGGPRGFVPYLRALEGVKDAYTKTNEQLKADWQANKADLFRLRDAASRYLWSDLHGYWLPRLLGEQEDDGNAAREFDRWVKSALRIPAIAKYLHSRPTTLIVGAFGRQH